MKRINKSGEVTYCSLGSTELKAAALREPRHTQLRKEGSRQPRLWGRNDHARTGNVDEPNPQKHPELKPFLFEANQSKTEVSSCITQTNPTLSIIDEPNALRSADSHEPG